MRSLPLRLPPRLRQRLHPAGLSTLMARRIAFSALAHALCAPSAVLADEPPGMTADSPTESTWGLGVGAITSQKAYKGIDRDTMALPLVYFENRWVRVLGPRVEVKLPSVDVGASQKLDFRLLARYDRSGYESDDAPILSGMEDRKGGFWAGARMTWHNEWADVSAELLADASSHSKGQSATISLEKRFHLGQHVMLVPRVSANWLSSKYVDYYYGVRDNEVRADRPAYVGESAMNAELGARATYLFDRSNSVFLDVGVTSLAKEIKDSPLVGRSTENRVALGYLYRF